MGLFSRRGKGGGGIDLSRIMDGFGAAQATLAGDYGGAAQIHQNRARTRALEAQAEREAEEARREQEADMQRQVALQQLGYSKAEIMAMSPQDASQNYRQRIDPYTLAPESERHNPGIGGQPASVNRAAPAMTQTERALRAAGIDPQSQQGQELLRSAAVKEAIILQTGIDPATGQPFSQAVDPRSLFDLGGAPQAGAPQGFGFGGPQAAPGAPQVPGPQGPAAGPPRISSQAEYDQLPPGATYIAPDGTPRRKGGAGQAGPQTFPGQWR